MPSPQPTQASPFAYVTDPTPGTVTVVDTATNAVVATVPVRSPGGIATSPDGNHVYITMRRNIADDTGFIAVLDPASHRVVAQMPVAEIGPDGIVITPDGARAYATGGDTVFVVDTAAQTVVATVPVGRQAGGIAISPDGRHVYVANFGDGTVSVLATNTNAVVATVQTATPDRIAVTPDGKHAYVTVGATVRVLDTATHTVAATIVVGNTELAGVAFSPDGKRAYIAGTERIGFNNLPGSFHGRMVVIDTATNAVEHAIPVPRTSLKGIAVSPDGKHAYFVGGEQIAPLDQPDSFVGQLVVLDTATNTGRSAHVGIDLADITLTPPRR